MSVFPSEAKLLFHCTKVGDAIVRGFSAMNFKIAFAFCIMMVGKPSAVLLAILSNAGVSGSFVSSFCRHVAHFLDWHSPLLSNPFSYCHLCG